jgi:hypothetical protein
MDNVECFHPQTIADENESLRKRKQNRVCLQRDFLQVFCLLIGKVKGLMENLELAFSVKGIVYYSLQLSFC